MGIKDLLAALAERQNMDANEGAGTKTARHAIGSSTEAVVIDPDHPHDAGPFLQLAINVMLKAGAEDNTFDALARLTLEGIKHIRSLHRDGWRDFMAAAIEYVEGGSRVSEQHGKDTTSGAGEASAEGEAAYDKVWDAFVPHLDTFVAAARRSARAEAIKEAETLLREAEAEYNRVKAAHDAEEGGAS